MFRTVSSFVIRRLALYTQK